SGDAARSALDSLLLLEDEIGHSRDVEQDCLDPGRPSALAILASPAGSLAPRRVCSSRRALAGGGSRIAVPRVAIAAETRPGTLAGLAGTGAARAGYSLRGKAPWPAGSCPSAGRTVHQGALSARRMSPTACGSAEDAALASAAHAAEIVAVDV